MPLRDHFTDSNDDRNWGPVHGAWPTVIALQLNRVLPKQFVARPQIEIGAMEIDLAALKRSAVKHNDGYSSTDDDALSEPVMLLEEPIIDDHFETLIYEDDLNNRLVAALEFISPANKDRPENREKFLTKCLTHLENGVSVAIVDVVTKRRINLYAELQEALGTVHTPVADALLYAVSCRQVITSKFRRLEAWEHELSVGGVLPVIPLWLSPDYYIMIDLEATYEATCEGLRIE